MKVLKSIGAVLAGLLFVFGISVATDLILEKSGMMNLPFSSNPLWLILFVTLYRNIYNIACCYMAAWLAPSRPMLHAMVLGTIGLAISCIGFYVMTVKQHEGPAWYAISLIVTAYPCAWLGGKIYLNQLNKKSSTPNTL